MSNTTIYTIEDVAKILQVSEATVRKLIREKLLTAFRVGPQLRITQEALDGYIRSQSQS